MSKLVETATASETVRVDLGARSYEIHIGPKLLDRTGSLLTEIAPESNCAVISDTNVATIYADTLVDTLERSGISAKIMQVDAGEASKSMPVFEQVLDFLLENRFERTDTLIALGGGVVGDLAGFAASTMRRGMKFVQVPTSLLAQVDSSVGGKTGINSRHGKNLIGAFYQPATVIVDTDTLKTLSPREFAAGYAEVAKYGLINKPDFFAWLEANHADIFAFGDSLTTAIATSCRAKAEVVAADEFEKGQRALLNLGHTFGHALEGYTGYDSSRLVHGEGVAIGITLAHEFSNRMNLCSIDCVDRVRHHFRTVGLPTEIGDIPGGKPDAEALMNYIAQDKKVVRGALTFILTRGIGQSFIADDVPPAEVQGFLRNKLS